MDIQGLLDAYQEGWASTNPALREQRAKEKRDLSAEEKKLRLANELAINLMQTKEQLARDNPKYIQFQKTPFGAIIGLDTEGNAKVVREGTPEERQEYMDDMASKREERTQKAELSKAQANYYNSGAKAQADQARAAASMAAAEASKARAGLLTGKTGLLGTMTPDLLAKKEAIKNQRLAIWARANIPRNNLTGEITPEDKQRYEDKAKEIDSELDKEFSNPKNTQGSSALQMMQSLLQPQDDEE